MAAERARPLLGWGLAALLVLVAVAGFLIEGDRTVRLEAALQPPSLLYWMGTDELGRDVFTRIVEGASLSLSISLAAWLIALGLGIMLGTLAGYYTRSPGDLVISWLIALAYVTPFLVLLVGLLGVIGPGLANAYLILVLFAWAAPARQTRVAVANIKHAQFVVAARSFGFSTGQLFRTVVIPQVYKPALLASLAILPEIIALDAALSFFGLGARPPQPTLGSMVVDGIAYLSIAWWMAVFPVVVLSVACLGVRYLSSIVAAAAGPAAN